MALFVVIPVTTTLIYLYGLTGAASSWVVYQLFVYAYMIPRICRECLVIRPVTWYAHIAKVLGLAAVTYGSLWVLVVVPYGHSTEALVIAYVVASAAFLAGAFLLIGPELRETVLGLRRRLPERKATGVG